MEKESLNWRKLAVFLGLIVLCTYLYREYKFNQAAEQHQQHLLEQLEGLQPSQ